MLTTSKRWATIVGFLVVTGVIVTASLRPASRALAPSADLAVKPDTAIIDAPSAAAPPPHPLTEVRTAPAPAPSAVPTPDLPHFDIVRVEPTGETVVAGQGAPNASVDLIGSGRVLAQAQTDASGHFVMVPGTLKTGDHALSLRQMAPGSDKPAVASAQSVAVSIPAKGKGAVVVALAEPGAPTRLLSARPAAEGPKPAAPPPAAAKGATSQQGVAIGAVELENGSGFYATGSGLPGTQLRLYLNNSRLADVVASAEGKWSVKLRKGLTGGHYVVRADASSADGSSVMSRAEVPFDVPSAMAEPAPAAGNKPADPILQAPMVSAQAPAPHTDAIGGASASPRGADAIVDEVSTTAVRTGDNLWDISRVRLGQGRRYTRIYAANVTQIRDPRLIYPGQVFVLPSQRD